MVIAFGPVHSARAAGPIETSVFAVQGVTVDVTDVDAATAKNKALIDAQMKAFVALAERLGSPELVSVVSQMEQEEVLPFLRSLSVEQESISPGRYIGKLTVRFLPAKVKSFYASYGVRISAEQGPAFLVLPVWQTAAGPQLWEENPWRQAWIDLHAEQSAVPIIVPIGDRDDSEIISAEDVVNNDLFKLEALRRRYDVSTIMVATASPAAEGGIHARMIGDSPLGKITFDKVYAADTGTIEDSARLATQRFHAVMVDKFRSNSSKQAGLDVGERQRQYVSVAVPFASPTEWNRLRSLILSTPGVMGIDVSSLSGDGAVINLAYAGNVEEIQAFFQTSGLQLSRAGGVWVISPL